MNLLENALKAKRYRKEAPSLYIYLRTIHKDHEAEHLMEWMQKSSISSNGGADFDCFERAYLQAKATIRIYENKEKKENESRED